MSADELRTLAEGLRAGGRIGERANERERWRLASPWWVRALRWIAGLFQRA